MDCYQLQKLQRQENQSILMKFMFQTYFIQETENLNHTQTPFQISLHKSKETDSDDSFCAICSSN